MSWREAEQRHFDDDPRDGCAGLAFLLVVCAILLSVVIVSVVIAAVLRKMGVT